MFIYKSRFLTRAEVWFDEEPGDTRSVDWLFYCYRSSPVPGAKTRSCHTYLIDLTQTADELWARVNSDTAYKIRRARDKDRIVCESLDAADSSVIDDFERMYNDFAPLKGLLPLDRGRIESMARAGGLDMSVAKDTEGNALVFHANYRNQYRASQMFLPSLYRKCADSAARNAIGRANRYLMWSDILRYKEQGLRAFDFGGWYTGIDTDMLKINEFKRGFGGEVVGEYKCEQLLTIKARLAIAMAGMLDRAKTLANRGKEPVAQPVYAKTKHCEVSAPV
jgi:hypothetical protein